MIDFVDEDGSRELQWVQGKTYVLHPEGRLTPEQANITFEWVDEEYKVSYGSETALWRRIREQAEWNGGLQLTDDEGKRVPVAELTGGQRYQLRPAEEDQWKPDLTTKDKRNSEEPDQREEPKQEQKITAVWVRMEMEIRYKENWEIWPAIRDKLPMKVG
jgi:Mg-chelatase subunit ChlI